MKTIFALIIILTAPQASYAAEAVFSGPACVIDGDSLVVGGERDAKGWCRGAIEVRLEGADAPEWDQPCQDDAGATWACGAAAKAAMAAMADGQEVTCRASVRDVYKRPLAWICATAAIKDLTAEMVRLGLAVDAAKRHRATQAEAKAARRGMWAGSFMSPHDWRALKKAKR